MRVIVAALLASGCASTVANTAAVTDATDIVVVDAAVDAAVDTVMDAGTPDDVPVAPRCPPRDASAIGYDDVAIDGAYVVDLSIASELHHCAVMSDGTLRCRGSNLGGRLGLGPDAGFEYPSVTVPGLHDVAQVVTNSGGATCTRHRDGTVRCWGWFVGDGGVGSQDATRDPACGCYPNPIPVDGIDDARMLAMDDWSACVIRSDRSLWCWGGSNSFLRDGPSLAPRRIPEISDVDGLWPMNGWWIVRTHDGHYHAIQGSPGDAGVPIPIDAVIADSTREIGWHLCFSLPDGTARCFGQNSAGQLGDPSAALTENWNLDLVDPGLCGVRSIVVGSQGTGAILDDGTVRYWGAALGPGASVDGLRRVMRVYLGEESLCAILADHSVWCAGRSPSLDENRALHRVAW